MIELILKGHDVSKWQGMNPADGDFLIAKASQGVTEADRTYASHRNRALMQGKLFGSYHWGEGNDPQKEAQFYVHHASRSVGEIMALDFEDSRLVSSAHPVQWSLQFLLECERLTGVRPLIYLRREFMQRFNWLPVAKANFGLWLAEWDRPSPSNPSPWDFTALWQSGDTHNTLDVDVFFGDRHAWLLYGSSATPPVPAKPRVYVVVDGDTLTKIAAHLHTTPAALARLNHLANPDLIYPGQHLNY